MDFYREGVLTRSVKSLFSDGLKGDALMTIRFPKKTLGDKILKLISRERSIQIPEGINDAHERFGQYADVLVKRESFWKALLRKQQPSE